MNEGVNGFSLAYFIFEKQCTLLHSTNITTIKTTQAAVHAACVVVVYLRGAEGGTRTPMPVKAQRPERCVSTNFTTSA